MTDPQVSVLVPVYNRADDLRRLLQDLDAQTGVSFEVVVVDDGSSPPLAPQFAEEQHPYPIVWRTHPENWGAGAARNTAVEAANGALFVFIDSDGSVPEADCLRLHHDFHSGEAVCPLPVAHPFVLHGRVEGINQTYWGRTFEYSNWFMSDGAAWRVLEDVHAPGHNTSVTREAFYSVGLFDAAFRVAEDAEWSIRARASGLPLVYTPEIRIFHRDRETFRAVWGSYLKMGEYAVHVRRKHPGSPYGFLYPKSRPQALLLLPLLVTALTLYIGGHWYFRDRRTLWYLPGMFVANVAYGIGAWRGLGWR